LRLISLNASSGFDKGTRRRCFEANAFCQDPLLMLYLPSFDIKTYNSAQQA
jgi:hypothetical protein